MKAREKPTYAIVEPVGGHGGCEFYIYGLARALSTRFRVLVYTCDETTIHKLHETQSRTFLFFRGIYGNRPMVLRLIAYFVAVVRTFLSVTREKASTVHLHVFHFSVLELGMVMLFRYLSGARTWVTVHDVQSFATYGREVGFARQRLLCRIAQKLIVHTEYAAELLKAKIPERDRRKVVIIPAGDLDFLYNNPVSHSEALGLLGLDPAFRYILFFGQIKRVKGLDVLLGAADLIQDRLRAQRIKLLVVGKVWKDEWERYADQMRIARIEDLVVRVGTYVTNEQVPYYFYSAEVIVLPYREIYNSGVLLRAMDYGTPIIASDVPVFKEAISPETGVLFLSESSSDLARALVGAIGDPNDMLRRAKAAKASIESRNSDSAIVRALL